MPLSAGAADKFGNRYEGRWTVYQMTEVMAERADSLCLEPPGDEGQGIEFWVCNDGARESHQVKRQHGSDGRWTLSSLNERGVLSAFQNRLLADPTATVVFVSTHAVRHLDELTDRARRAAGAQEFDREFLKSTELRASFDQLRSYWENCSLAEAFERIKRVRVRTFDEDSLQTIVESQVEILVDGQPASLVAAALFQFALDQVHHELTAVDIWRHLETQGCRRRDWNKDPRVLAAVEKQNRRYTSLLRDEAIGQSLFARTEATVAVEKLVSATSRQSVALIGEAGIGKSSVTPEVLEQLTQLGWPVLAFRIDHMESASTPEQVGENLGLPGSPANVLAAISHGREAALFIDQLDAVSLASGRRPAFFECINEVIKQALSHPNLHLVLGCRKFDVENDPRFRRLFAQPGIETVTVKGLSAAEVREQVAQLGLDQERLTPGQLDLLSVPLHLSLLAEVAEVGDVQALTFASAKDLYDKFWTRKQDLVSARLEREVEWSKVIDKLCDYMNEHQVLAVPENVMDDHHSRDARAMVSEHVLRFDEAKYSFFHESFFDYAFARRFASRKVRLLPFLLADEQHLFRRAQVRQILLHEREADRSVYLHDFSATLLDERVRFHLKNAIFALLVGIEEPTTDEWDVLATAIHDTSHQLYAEVWNLLYHSPAWFQLVDSLGLIKQWLSDDDAPERINLAVNVLRGMQRLLPDRVAELVEPRIGLSLEWNKRIAWLIQWSDMSLGSQFQQFIVRAIDSGIIDDVRGPIVMNSDFWDLSHNLPEKNPARAVEIISHFYQRCIEQALQNGGSEATTRHIIDSFFNTARNGHEDYFLKTATGAPKEFVAEILPVMLRVMELTVQRREGASPPWSDAVWFFRQYNEIFGSRDALLEGMVQALMLVAFKHPQEFAAHAANLSASEFETAHFLLIRGYAGNPARFADEAALYLCAQPERLRIGYSSDQHWSARLLIQKISPHCSPTILVQLEDLLLNYYPPWELRPDRRITRGHAQFTLLEGIAPDYRSERVLSRIEELKRKFQKETVAEPIGMVAGVVGSPISDEAARKMSDEQWLRAIDQYDNDGLETKLGSEGFVGGATELSRVLEAQAKQDPRRFATLACRFPDETNLNYFEAVLRGVADGGLDLSLATQLLVHCHALPTQPAGRSIAWLIARLAELPFPDAILKIAAFYATDDPDPNQELWSTEASSGQAFFGGSIDMAAINSTRGAAADAVGRLIAFDPSRLQTLLPTVEHLVADDSIAVRAATARVLLAVVRPDRDLAVQLFLTLCQTEDILLSTEGVFLFMKANLTTHFQELTPVLTRMIAATDEATNTAGARLACMAALFNKEAQAAAEACLKGNEAHRKGAAQVFAANLGQARFRRFCEQHLVRLFNDPASTVRSDTAICFAAVTQQLSDYSDLISSFVTSEAFLTDHRSLFQALDETPCQLPDTTCAASERFFEIAGMAAADISTHAAAESYIVSKLVIRTYAQNNSVAIKTRCLNLIDRIVRTQAIGLNEAIADYER